MRRLVVTLVFLLRLVAAYGDDNNYMLQSGMFASIATIEDMLFPESVMMKKLEQYHDRLDGSLQTLKRYLEAWREMDLEPDIKDGTSSRKRYLDIHKTAFKMKEKYLTKRLLDSRDKVKNDRLRGDTARINQGEIIYPDEDDSAEKETQELEKELDEARQNYKGLTSEFMANQTYENSSAVGEKRQTTPSGGGVQHPVDAYLLMKRLTVNWAAVRTKLLDLQSDTAAVFQDLDEQRDLFMFPTTADLHGAAVALVRLQDVYGLNMADLGAGIIPGKVSYDNKDVRSIGQLRTWDYILLGKQAYSLNYFNRAIQWFKMAVKASESEQLEGEELDIISKLKQTIDNHESPSLEDKSKKKKKKKKGKAFKLHQRLTAEEDAAHQRLLCRGQKFLSPEYESTLSCRLERLKSAYLLLMPLKMEELHHSPRIVKFHHFLTDSQIKYIVKRAKPSLDHSTHGGSNGVDVSMIRVSMTGWLTEDTTTRDDPLTSVTRKIQEATDMEVRKHEDAEEYQELAESASEAWTGSCWMWVSPRWPQLGCSWLQFGLRIYIRTPASASRHSATVSGPGNISSETASCPVANYGIGGLYNAHPDYGMSDSSSMGDRLGTFLIYLSDVHAGGATVFTRLGVRATPERGTALFWYNLYTEGIGDHLTIHAACPVLHGSKWITTKWIHYNSQFLKRSCGLRLGARFQYP